MFAFRKELLTRLSRIEQKLDAVLKLEVKEMGQIEDMQSAVADNKTVTESVVTLLGKLHDALIAAKGNPAAMDAVIAGIKANTEALAAAAVANTVAADETAADQHRAGQ